jgi:ribosomal protein S18 acetylase RimI-like enzyme
MAQQLAQSTMRLRPFVEADDLEVGSWFADAGELRFFAGPRLRWPLDSGQWRSIRLDPSVAAWTAVLGDNDIPVGHGELITDSPTTIRLARFAISPALRGNGLGRALLRLLVAKSREAGFGLLSVAVHPDNTNAIVSYRTFGFEPSTESASAGRLRMELKLDSTLRI